MSECYSNIDRRVSDFNPMSSDHSFGIFSELRNKSSEFRIDSKSDSNSENSRIRLECFSELSRRHPITRGMKLRLFHVLQTLVDIAVCSPLFHDDFKLFCFKNQAQLSTCVCCICLQSKFQDF